MHTILVMLPLTVRNSIFHLSRISKLRLVEILDADRQDHRYFIIKWLKINNWLFYRNLFIHYLT